MKKRLLITLFGLLIILLMVCFSNLTLVKQYNRNYSYTLSRDIRSKVIKETKGMNAVDILNYSIEFTSKYLQFSENNNIPMGKANCIGYANFCSSIYNTAIFANNIKGYAKPVVGYVEFYKINLCSILKNIIPNQKYKNFVKNHDFVEFCIGDDLIYADPCIYDLIGTDCKTFRNGLDR